MKKILLGLSLAAMANVATADIFSYFTEQEGVQGACWYETVTYGEGESSYQIVEKITDQAVTDSVWKQGLNNTGNAAKIVGFGAAGVALAPIGVVIAGVGLGLRELIGKNWLPLIGFGIPLYFTERAFQEMRETVEDYELTEQLLMVTQRSGDTLEAANPKIGFDIKMHLSSITKDINTFACPDMYVSLDSKI